MSDERRYHEDEIAQIFEAASKSGASERALTPAEGLTLTELQAIGRQVGLAPERVAAAASTLDRHQGALPRRRDLGMPIGVGRTVDLPRAPTDREWELLVAELRETFGARGKITVRGEAREWSNGNLHAYVAPTETGYALRLGTLKSDGVGLNRMGIGIVATGAFLGAMQAVTGGVGSDLIFSALVSGGGVGAMLLNALRLRGWAGEREAQMEHIAERARALIRPEPESAPKPEDAPAPTG